MADEIDVRACDNRGQGRKPHPSDQTRRVQRSGHNAAIRGLRARRLRPWWCRHCRRRQAAQPIPAISAKTPNAAIMLPSVSQSISKNPTAAAIAIYLFSIGNCTPSRRPNPRRLPSVRLLPVTPERLLPGGDGEDGPHELRRCLTDGRGLAPELAVDRGRHRYFDNDHRPRR
jgi:hypothetical protein